MPDMTLASENISAFVMGNLVNYVCCPIFQEEWGKIKRLVAERGTSYKTAREARKYLKSLWNTTSSLLLTDPWKP